MCIRDSFCFGRGKQTATESGPAPGLDDPHLAQITGPSPCVTRYSGKDIARFVAQEDTQSAAIIDSGRYPIEFVELLSKKLNVVRRRLLEEEIVGLHGF